MSTPTPGKSSPIRILMLHGFTQSGTLFHSKTRALEKQLQKSLPGGAELVYPSGPMCLRVCDIPDTPSLLANFTFDDIEGAEGEWHAWSRWNEGLQEYTEFDKAWEFLSNFLDEQGPFDGVIGFSQGGAFAAALASLLEPERKDHRPQSFTTNHPEFKFAVNYSGFKFFNPKKYWYFYDPVIRTPILHFIGSLDTVVTEDRTLDLVRCCGGGKTEDNSLLVYHPGGHYVPTGKPYLVMLIKFIIERISGVEGEIVEEAAEGTEGRKKDNTLGPKDEWEDMPF